MAIDEMAEHAERVPVGEVELDGDLGLPADARGVVLFAHGSGSGRHSPRNRQAAGALQRAVLASVVLLALHEQRAKSPPVPVPSRVEQALGAESGGAHSASR